MDLKKLRKELPPGALMPESLVKLFKYAKKSKGVLACDFRLSTDGRQDALDWFDGDEDAASQFVIFGSDGTQSLYGFWRYDDQPLEQAPVVYLNGEGVRNTVLANDLTEFLSLLALGRERIGSYRGWTDEPECEKAIKPFRKWLRDELGIAPPKNGLKIIERARAAHPDLDKWIARWMKTHKFSA
jgi:hypothetical protein